MNKAERFVLSILSLVIGIGVAYVVNAVVWRTGGPIWIKAAIVGTVALVGYIVFDRQLFKIAEQAVQKVEAKRKKS